MTTLIFGCTLVSQTLPCCWVLDAAVLTVGDVIAETTVAVE